MHLCTCRKFPIPASQFIWKCLHDQPHIPPLTSPFSPIIGQCKAPHECLMSMEWGLQQDQQLRGKQWVGEHVAVVNWSQNDKIGPTTYAVTLVFIAVARSAWCFFYVFPLNSIFLCLWFYGFTDLIFNCCTNQMHPSYSYKTTLLFFLFDLFPVLLSLVSDSLSGEDSLLGCDLLSHTSPHGNQSVSALPSSSSSCSSALLASGSGSCLEEVPAAQRVSGKSSCHFAAPVTYNLTSAAVWDPLYNFRL